MHFFNTRRRVYAVGFNRASSNAKPLRDWKKGAGAKRINNAIPSPPPLFLYIPARALKGSRFSAEEEDKLLTSPYRHPRSNIPAGCLSSYNGAGCPAFSLLSSSVRFPIHQSRYLACSLYSRDRARRNDGGAAG